MSNISLTSLRTTLLSFKKDLSDVGEADFILWCNFANRQFYNFILGIDPERFISTSNFTVSTAPQTSALPADFMSIQPLGCGFYEVDDNSEDTEYDLTRTGFGSRQIGYYIQSTNVVFTGIEDGTVYKLRYIPRLTTLTAMSDTVVLDEIYTDAFVKDLDVLYNLWDEESGAESLSDFRFTRTLEELGNNIKREPDAFAIPETLSNF